MDARGNKAGVFAEFDPPVEKLAFLVKMEGEANLPEIWSDPLPEVVRLLDVSANYQEVLDQLPDIELIK